MGHPGFPNIEQECQESLIQGKIHNQKNSIKGSNIRKGHVQKHRQDWEHPKNAQFDIYEITSNFFNKFQWNFAKKLIVM